MTGRSGVRSLLLDLFHACLGAVVGAMAGSFVAPQWITPGALVGLIVAVGLVRWGQ